jgi:hypothetical protein
MQQIGTHQKIWIMKLCQTHVVLESMNQCYSLSRIKVIIFFDPKPNIYTYNFTKF